MKSSALALIIIAVLALSSCGAAQSGSGSTEESGKENATQGAGVGSNKPMSESGFKIDVPQDWVEIDGSILGTYWKRGYDNSQTNPTVRLKYTDDFGDNSNVDYVASELLAQGKFGDSYGMNFEVEHREYDQEFEGSDKSVVTVFKYESKKGAKMRGCWWVLRNAQTSEVAVAEIHGRQSAVTDSLLNEFQSSISFSDR